MRNGLRIAAVAVVAALAFGAAGAAQARDDTVLEVRIPQVPAETLPPMALPGDPSSPVRVRIEPGDVEAPDPAPRVIITIGGG